MARPRKPSCVENGTTTLAIGDFPTRHPYYLGIFQNQIERIMAAWIAELPVRIH